MAEPVTEFVAGWNIVQVLGEGAFGEVKLLVNPSSGEAVAMKVVDLAKHSDAAEAVRKEICIHRIMKHENIIKYYGSRREQKMQYIFLEYASGGELFDRIEPDVGMQTCDAQRYFVELINGVEYLHSRGVAHRDLKPENLLLDGADHLKITDFGMATLFRHNGVERELDRCCGTKPYMAPEVLFKPYSAQQADIWSCGVILVVLLAGELPWDEPTFTCREYIYWKDKDCSLLTTSPWTKIDNLALALLRKVLNSVPRHRATLEAIKSHQWFNKKFVRTGAGLNDSVDSHVSPTSKKICSEMESPNSALSLEDLSTRLSCSQPQPRMGSVEESCKEKPEVYSFSQPAKPEQMLLATQSQGTQAASQSPPLQRLVKRMTRVLVRTNLEETVKRLENLFAKMNYAFRSHATNVMTVTTVDRRGSQLIFKANIIDMGAHILVDFRLSKGCGLDFKRHFLRIKEGLSGEVIQGPVSWSYALANNMLPS